MAISAFFNPQTGQLNIVGDALVDNINITRTAAGTILINGGDVDISGGPATVDNTTRIFALGLAGDDLITLNETNGALPRLFSLGGSGGDVVFGGGASDFLFGGSGNDLLRGLDGDDTIIGGTGNDLLLGDRGNDIVHGRAGDDLIVWNNGNGSDRIEGGDGFDTVQVNGANGAGDFFQVQVNGDRIAVQQTNPGFVTLDIGTVEILDINGQGGNDALVGSTGLAALGVSLDLDGGEGDDLVIGGDGADVIRGGAGNDTALGGRGDDIVQGGDGNDILIWNNGDGDDVLDGGGGVDVVQVNTSNIEGDDIRLASNGDRVKIERVNGDAFTLDVGTAETIDVNLLGGNDRFTAGGGGLAALTSLEIDGGGGLDTITGADGNDLIDGGFDNDILRGRSGDDELIGNRGDDLVFGEGDDDRILWSQGDGNDRIDGGDGQDTAQFTYGDLDNHIELAAPGPWIRIQETVSDISTNFVRSTELIHIRTGDGDDQVTIRDVASAPDLETIIVDGDAGNDVIVGSGLQTGVSLIVRSGEGNDLAFGGAGDDALLAGDGHDQIIAGGGNDFASGGTGNDVLVTGAGNDVVLGGDGNDVIVAGSGNDILLGGDGNDVLNGGAGIDFIDGGAGADSAINGETVINVPFAASANAEVARQPAVSIANIEAGLIGVHWDPEAHGADVLTNFEIGVDTVVIAGLGDDAFRFNAMSFDAVSEDHLRLEEDDLGRSVLSVNTGDSNDADAAFHAQWIFEGEAMSDLTMSDLWDSLIFV